MAAEESSQVEQQSQDSDPPPAPTDNHDDRRPAIEKALLKSIDNIIRELVKLKLMSRPKGSTPKEQKIKELIDRCMERGEEEEGQQQGEVFLEKTIELMEKNNLGELSEELRLLARPPPPPEVEEEEMTPDAEAEELAAQAAADAAAEEAKKIEEVVDTGPKAKPYTEVIEESTGTFVDCLVLDKKLLDNLEDNSVINLEMRSKIMCRPNRAEKVRVFLSFMMGLGPQSLQLLIEALRSTKQDFLANILAANAFT